MHDNFVEQWKDVMVCATLLHLQNIALTLLLFGCQADVKSRAEILGILWLLDGATSGVKIENIVSVCKTQCNGLWQTVQRAVSDPGCLDSRYVDKLHCLQIGCSVTEGPAACSLCKFAQLVLEKYMKTPIAKPTWELMETLILLVPQCSLLFKCATV